MGGVDLSSYLWPSANQRRQPDAGLVVNRAHPLAAYFSHVWVPGLSGREGAIDLLGGSKLVPFGTGVNEPFRRPTRSGMALDCVSGSTATQVVASFPGANALPITLFFLGYAKDVNNNYDLLKLLAIGGSGSNVKAIRHHNFGMVGYESRENSGTSAQIFIAGGALKWLSCISQSLSANDHRLWVNGSLSKSTTNTGNPASTYNAVSIGTPSVSVVVAAAAGFKAIPDHIAADLSRDPDSFWEIFEPQARIFALAPVGAAIDLAGDAIATAGASASLSTQVKASGAAASVATAAGALTTEIKLSGVAASISVASGTLTVQIKLGGSSLAQAAAIGSLTTQIKLGGAAMAQATSAGTLTTQIRLDGDAVAQALASASLTTSPSGLSGLAGGAASATGQLSTGIRLIGSPSAIAISAAGLTTSIRLSGAAVSVCNVTGNLLVSVSLSGSALALASGAGALSTQIRLNAGAVARSLAAGQLAGTLGPSAWIDPRYSVRMAKRAYVARFRPRH